MIPARVAMALQADGWWLRSDSIWKKPNPMPESVTDRPTSSHEHIFLLSKSKRYYYDADAIREEMKPGSKERYEYSFGGKKNEKLKEGDDPTALVGDREPTNGRNKRDVWEVTTKPFSEAHFAVYPPELILPCIQAGSAEGDTVLDPFSGAGTTGLVALKQGREYIGIELSKEYAEMSARRIREECGTMFANVNVRT